MGQRGQPPNSEAQMNISGAPLVAIGTLSGNLPKNATTAAGPLPGANGAPAGGPVGLNQSGAAQGVSLTPFKSMKISSGSGSVSFSSSQLAFLQNQFEQQSADALSGQSNGL